MPTIHLLIKGKVQGVFYRATAKKVADQLTVKGWIKNTQEGNVEAMLTGSDDQLQEFIKWSKIGPEKAHVTHVTVTVKEENIFDDFEIIRGG